MIEYLQRPQGRGTAGRIYCSTHGSRRQRDAARSSPACSTPSCWRGTRSGFTSSRILRASEDRPRLRRPPRLPASGVPAGGRARRQPAGHEAVCRRPAVQEQALAAARLVRRRSQSRSNSADVLRVILDEPASCAVVPGSLVGRRGRRRCPSPATRRSTCRPEGRAAIERPWPRCGRRCAADAASARRRCSRGLPIPAMFRDAYIWTLRNETIRRQPHGELLRHPLRTPVLSVRHLRPTRPACCPQGIARCRCARGSPRRDPGPARQPAASRPIGVCWRRTRRPTAGIRVLVSPAMCRRCRARRTDGGAASWCRMPATHNVDRRSAHRRPKRGGRRSAISVDGRLGTVLPAEPICASNSLPPALRFAGAAAARR